MVAIILGAFVTLLNQTLLNVALPKIMEDLAISTNTAQWLTTGFMLVNGVLIPLSAYFIGRFSTRQLFITAMLLFLIGTIFCAFAGNFEFLMAGRIIQAAGAGIMMPLMSIVVLTIFKVEERGKAMGMMGVAMIFAPAVGPTLSGWIVEHYHWHVLFYVIMPLALIALLVGLKYMKNVNELTMPKLNALGVILSTLGFGGLLFGFSEAGNDGWDSAMVIVSLAVGAIALVLFILKEFFNKIPLLEFRVFRYDMFTLTTAINILVTMAMYAGMILTPIYMQNILGLTPIKSGLALLPGAILMGIMSPVTGAIFDKIGARWLSVVGLLITAATTWEFTQLTVDTTYTHMVLIYTIRMFGMSLLMMPVQTAGMNQLPQRLNPHGSAMSQTLRTVGGALGTAWLVTVMSTKAKSVATELMIAGQVDQNDKAAMLDVSNHATVSGINHAFQYAFWLTVSALVLAFFIRKTKPAKDFAVKDHSEKNASEAKKPARA
ncbi:DHA2 family efflux MFS transporter permease subunit [Cohnella fermenti]|uniref:DHA2 family efflux MFS transporter permease subunit n=2 Tax=Cohnella fermenti TaxID=2565925 RepID=A0A4S4C1H4_9BACL|nr:DHA2 family efflux MFS transporter permease subunit [Cohnella fermenti]